MSVPSVQRSDRSGTVRPAPHINRWSPVALARRRALAVVVAEAEAAWLRDDPPAVVNAWRALVAALTAAPPVAAIHEPATDGQVCPSGSGAPPRAVRREAVSLLLRPAVNQLAGGTRHRKRHSTTHHRKDPSP